MTTLPSPAAVRMPLSLPQYALSKGRHSTTIKIGSWTITATKRPILNGKEIDAVEKQLNLPLPEMTFGNNSLGLHYDPSSPPPNQASSSKLVSETKTDTAASTTSTGTIRFDTIEALAGVGTGEGWEERVGGGVQVSMAEKWGKNRDRQEPSLLSDTPLPSKPIKPHDWTYSTCYAGNSAAGPSSRPFEPASTHSIPMSLLARQDPVLDQILYYEDVPLFEDELHDHGESILSVRIRVMPHSFFILSRLFVRVDNVLFRIHDVRIYHSFTTDEVIREISGMEAEYEEVKRRLEKSTDLSPLTDTNFVNNVMMSLSSGSYAGPPHEMEQSRKPWPGLGRRVEVLRLLPDTRDESAMRGMEGLAL